MNYLANHQIFFRVEIGRFKPRVSQPLFKVEQAVAGIKSGCSINEPSRRVGIGVRGTSPQLQLAGRAIRLAVVAFTLYMSTENFSRPPSPSRIILINVVSLMSLALFSILEI